jgi:hypothetical protein
MRYFDDLYGESPEDELKGYDASQVCLNGHLISTFARTQPEHNKNFCDKCGAATICKCQKCDADIRGHFFEPGVINLVPPGPPPSFCHNCGNAYPWTEQRLRAAGEVADGAEELDENEKLSLKDSVEVLVRNKPSAPNAIIKYKKLAAKAGKQVADGLKSLLVDVLSEAIKKQMWP